MRTGRCPRFIASIRTIAVVIINSRERDLDPRVRDAGKRRSIFVVFRNCQALASPCQCLSAVPYVHSGPTPRGRPASSFAATTVEQAAMPASTSEPCGSNMVHWPTMPLFTQYAETRSSGLDLATWSYASPGCLVIVSPEIKILSLSFYHHTTNIT